VPTKKSYLETFFNVISSLFEPPASYGLSKPYREKFLENIRTMKNERLGRKGIGCWGHLIAIRMPIERKGEQNFGRKTHNPCDFNSL